MLNDAPPDTSPARIRDEWMQHERYLKTAKPAEIMPDISRVSHWSYKRDILEFVICHGDPETAQIVIQNLDSRLFTDAKPDDYVSLYAAGIAHKEKEVSKKSAESLCILGNPLLTLPMVSQLIAGTRKNRPESAQVLEEYLNRNHQTVFGWEDTQEKYQAMMYVVQSGTQEEMKAVLGEWAKLMQDKSRRREMIDYLPKLFDGQVSNSVDMIFDILLPQLGFYEMDVIAKEAPEVAAKQAIQYIAVGLPIRPHIQDWTKGTLNLRIAESLEEIFFHHAYRTHPLFCNNQTRGEKEMAEMHLRLANAVLGAITPEKCQEYNLMPRLEALSQHTDIQAGLAHTPLMNKIEELAAGKNKSQPAEAYQPTVAEKADLDKEESKAQKSFFQKHFPYLFG